MGSLATAHLDGYDNIIANIVYWPKKVKQIFHFTSLQINNYQFLRECTTSLPPPPPKQVLWRIKHLIENLDLSFYEMLHGKLLVIQNYMPMK